MIQERHFDDICRSVGTGILADKVVIALARFQTRKQLREPDRDSLELACSYLKQAAQGPSALQKEPLSSSSLERALILDEATEALSLELLSASGMHRAAVSQYFNRLLETLRAIEDGRDPAQDDVTALRSFFASLGRHTLSEVSAAIAGDVDQEGTAVW